MPEYDKLVRRIRNSTNEKEVVLFFLNKLNANCCLQPIQFTKVREGENMPFSEALS